MLSENNWIELSWQGKIPRDYKENLSVRFNNKSKGILPFDIACDNTAKQIASSYDNLYLAMSGGADSEHVANVLIRNNIKFTPAIITWQGASNPENKYALKWCKNNNLEPFITEFSLDILHNGTLQNLISIQRPRLIYSAPNILLAQEIEKRNGHLITGAQVEYFPDEQFHFDDGISKDYKGFLINESDTYWEIMSPNRHPWAFFYWNPEMLASTVYHWDTDLDMTEAKEKLYGTNYRPKLFMFREYGDLIPPMLDMICSKFGSTDCVLLGDKDKLLGDLVG